MTNANPSRLAILFFLITTLVICLLVFGVFWLLITREITSIHG